MFRAVGCRRVESGRFLGEPFFKVVLIIPVIGHKSSISCEKIAVPAIGGDLYIMEYLSAIRTQRSWANTYDFVDLEGRMSVDWLQRTVELPPMPRGCHLVTRYVLNAIPELAAFRVGLMNVFLQHTSASLSINENADPDVPLDLEDSLTAIAPESFPYRHTCEGPDDMPAHVKSSLLGCALTVPIAHGRPCFGTWQGIYLCEHRDRATSRKVVVTINGQRVERVE